jgi:hypothetical protein
MEELHQELVLCVDFNRMMQDSLRDLLERAGGLKGEIEAIQALKMPITSLDSPARDEKNSAESRSGTLESDTSLNVSRMGLPRFER